MLRRGIVLCGLLVAPALLGADCGGTRRICVDGDEREVPCPDDDAGPVNISFDAGPRPDAGTVDAGPERPYESICDPDAEARCQLFECLRTPDGWQDGADEGYCTKLCADHSECGDPNLYRCEEGERATGLRCRRNRDGSPPGLQWAGGAGTLWLRGPTSLGLIATDDRSLGALSVSVDGEQVQVTSGALQNLGDHVSQTFTVEIDPGESTSLTVTASVVDGVGNTSPSVERTLQVDETAPSVSIVREANGILPGGCIPSLKSIKANASDNIGVARVSYFVGDNLITASSDAPDYATMLDMRDVVRTRGTYTLRAVAEDAAGNTAEDAFDLTIQPGTCP
jgi:hypothetical protein